MGVRLLLLAVVTLGSLYVLHLLAQDFMKLSKPLFMAFGKRDTENVNHNRTAALMEFEAGIDWNRILKNDPMKCALSLICQLAAGAESENQIGSIIYDFITFSIENNRNVAYQISDSYEKGLSYGGSAEQQHTYKQCYQHYPLCPYSAKAMLKIIQFFSDYNVPLEKNM